MFCLGRLSLKRIKRLKIHRNGVLSQDFFSRRCLVKSKPARELLLMINQVECKEHFREGCISNSTPMTNVNESSVANIPFLAQF